VPFKMWAIPCLNASSKFIIFESGTRDTRMVT